MSIFFIQDEEKLNYENNLIAYNQRKLESERKRRLQQKFNLKKDVDEQLQILNEKNRKMQDEKFLSKEEHNELMKQRAMAEILKEESYKNVAINHFKHISLLIVLSAMGSIR